MVEMYDMAITFFKRKYYYNSFYTQELIENPYKYFIIGMKYASNVKILPNLKYYQENDIACMG